MIRGSALKALEGDETEIVSLRAVDWARMEPNFFVVFEPGVFV